MTGFLSLEVVSAGKYGAMSFKTKELSLYLVNRRQDFFTKYGRK